VFASKTDMASAFSAELCGFMTVIEIAAARGWRNLWIESDSLLVVMPTNPQIWCRGL
jgi:hypothetical protein